MFDHLVSMVRFHVTGRLWLNTGPNAPWFRSQCPGLLMLNLIVTGKSTMRLLLSALLVISVLAGCSGKDQKPAEMGEREIYEAAQRNLKDESYALAIRNLQLLEARYPFGPYASQAQLELIYAHYRNYEPEAA